MIDLIVTLNGEEFEIRAKADDYNGDLPDFNAAVKGALYAQFLAHPNDPLDSASLEVAVRRVYTDVAARDGVFDDPESPRSDLAEDDSDEDAEAEKRSAAARKAARTRRANRPQPNADDSSDE